jgi:predicted RNase H-like HicB family nuclease
MNYKVVLHESEEGFGVSCPGLPGCWSQGTTEEEALENIRVAIQEYLAALPAKSFDETLAPIRQRFQESGMSEDDLEALFEEAREEVYREPKSEDRRAR